jgi:hypothetical protein
LQEGDDRFDHVHVGVFGPHHADGFSGKGAFLAVQLPEDMSQSIGTEEAQHHLDAEIRLLNGNIARLKKPS